MRWKWTCAAVLGVIAVTLAGFWAVPRLFPGLGWGLNEFNQLAGIASLPFTVASLLVAMLALRVSLITDDRSEPASGGTMNTNDGNVTGTAVQAETVEGGVGNTTRTGDRIDFSGGTFHDKVVGKYEEHHHNHPAPAPSALHAVPAPPDGFTGRADQLRELRKRINPTESSDGAGAVVVSALAGMGGIGKTALAFKAAAVAADQGWFCAQLFVDLHGYTPHTPPVKASSALDILLRQMGVDPDDIPMGLGERAGFYRSALHALTHADHQSRPVLVVADNAGSLDQVEPLLPGAGGHRLLVTSRERLTVQGHQPLTLDTLNEDEAIELIAARLGPTDPRTNDGEGLAALVDRCDYLPLALKIAAALLARTPHLDPATLVGRLADSSRFDDGRDDLAAVFDASLAHLPADRVEAFALLGANPGPDIFTLAAAVLTDLDPEAVEPVLEELAAAHLLTAHPGGRWSMHDLLADHARHHPVPTTGTDQAGAGQHDPRGRALHRLLDFYTTTAGAANGHLRALDGDTLPEVFSDRAQALEWLEAEHDNLIAAVYIAHQHGHTHTAIDLPAFLALYLDRQRRFSDAITVHTLARDTAQQVGDAHGEANAWNNLGVALAEVQRFPEAIDTYQRTRALHQQMGDVHREAMVWNNLGNALRQVGRLEEAINALTFARDLYQQQGDAHREAMVWNNLGLALAEVGRSEKAIDAYQRAHTLFQQQGDAHSEAQAWGNLGVSLAEARRFEEAIDALTRARALFQQQRDAHREAGAWNNLGNALQEVGRFEEAIQAHQRDLAYCQRAGDAQGEATAWNNLGLALQKAGRGQEACGAFERAVQRFRDTTDAHSLAVAQENLTRLQQRRR